MILKSRAILPPRIDRDNILRPTTLIPFKTESETQNYLEFVRLTNEVGARPAVFHPLHPRVIQRYKRVILE